MCKVALLIPTMNRSDFMIRQLNYYASLSSPHPIYIGDASNESEKKKTESAIESFKDKLDIHYHHLPGMNIRKTITYLGEVATEEFCAIICDDDYLIPASVEKCASFLSHHSDYRTAQGKAIIFGLNESGPYGTIKGSMVYWDIKSVEKSTAAERVAHFGQNYWVPQFSVHRRTEFVEDSVVYRNIEDEAFGEILHCYTFICNGKSKYIDCLYLIRQSHDARYEVPGILDWITDTKWNPSYQLFINAISSCITKTDGIPLSESKEVIRNAFKNYLKAVFRNKLKDTTTELNFTFFEKCKNKTNHLFHRFIDTKPILKRRLKNVRATFKSNTTPFDFDSVLKKNSPYYKDAKPVYDNFSRPDKSLLV